MKEFRIGQRVRVVKAYGHDQNLGKVGTITSKAYHHDRLILQDVEFDDVLLPPDKSWAGSYDCFEPIDDNTGDWRVIEHVTKWNPYKEKMPS